MLNEAMIKVELAANYKTINMDESVIYTLNIFNKSHKDMKNVILSFSIMDGLSLIGGAIKRERGMMDIDDQYIDLEIGNLAPSENAKIIIEFKLDDNFLGRSDQLPIEMKCYAMITFDHQKKIKETITSNIVETKIIDLN